MTQAERLKKLKYLRNPELEEQEVLYNLLQRVETIDEEPVIPEKGVDYFTEDDVQEIIDTIRGIIKDGVDGEKGEKGDKGDLGEPGAVGPQGIQGVPGKNGMDGKTPNIDKALKDAFSKLPKNEPVDTNAIVKQALEAFQEKYKDDSLKLTALEKRLIRLGGGGASFLSQLQDVLLSSPSNGETIIYNETTQKWENGPGGAGGSQDLQEVTDIGSITTNTITISPSGNNKALIANGSGSGIGIDITHAGSGTKLKIGTTGAGDLIEAGSFNVDNNGNVVGNNLSGTNTGDQLMYGTIAVAGQSDLDPTGTGDTLVFENGTGVELTTDAGTNTLTITNTLIEDSFGIVVDGAGTAITTGSKGTKYIPWDCTITGWDIRSDISGSCVFNVKRAGVSLAGTEKPTLSASSSNSDLALSTWTTSLLAGDVVEFVVDSASTLTRATVTILVNKL